MKPKLLQIQAPIKNLFIVLIISKSGTLSNNGILKKVSLLILKSYIIFNLQLLKTGKKPEISVQDGKLKITETSLMKSKLIMSVGGIIIYAQNNVFKAETYIILLTNLLGITFLLHSNDWILTIISWEIFNMSLYLLVSLRSENEAGLSASLKYFLLSALSTTLLLLGVCILYYKTGSTNYEIINISLIEQKKNPSDMWIIEVSFSLILITLLFKLSAAPFYQWAPDLYENIENKITKWKIIIPKLTVLSFLFQLTNFFTLFLDFISIQYILLISGILSVFIGSIALSNQWYIKRFLAYSGISHIGFMLLALASLAPQGYIFYMLIYVITTLNLFTIFLLLSEYMGRDVKKIQDLSGTFRNHPFISIALALNLFSLAGVCLLIK